MNFKQVIFKLNPFTEELAQIIIAILSDNDYDAFVEERFGFSAYIPENKFDTGLLNKVLSDPVFLNTAIDYQVTELPEKNWNKEWEKSYDPIVIDNICSIIAPFHNEQSTEYNIRIEPKMSFGTGHHETTRLMIRQIYHMDLFGKQGLDVGSGTGILGIFSILRGASFMTALDIDDWAFRNCIENFSANGIPEQKREIIKGDISLLGDKKYDFILANINKNILVKQFDQYLELLKPNGNLIISGILKTDAEVFYNMAKGKVVSFASELCENNWISLKFSK